MRVRSYPVSSSLFSLTMATAIVALVATGCGPDSGPGGPVGELESALRHCAFPPAGGINNTYGDVVASPDTTYGTCGWFGAAYNPNPSGKTIKANAIWHDASPNQTDCPSASLNVSVTGINAHWNGETWIIDSSADLGSPAANNGVWSPVFGACLITSPLVTESPSTAWDSWQYILVEGQAKLGSTYKKVEVQAQAF
jgi:hypothetical protein